MPSNAAAALQIDRSELLAGRYRPLKPLGAGGSGQVWLSLDEHTGREVALKIVAREGRAPQRAEREAQAVSRLHHPGCARSLTLAEDHEHVYLVYEYIPGRTLREALRTRELTDGQVIELSAQLLETLDHAHGQGVVHRDVKPTNVILEEGPGIRIRLLDFGLALIDDDDPLTAEGDVPGTLAYISPERLDGTEATEAADVWATALVLWEGLCGRHPFFGDPAARTTERILAGPGSLADERPELPQALIEAVDSALALDPSARPSAGELAGRLREIAQARRRSRGPRKRARLDRQETAGRALHATLSGTYAAAMLMFFSFLPGGFTLPVALMVGTASFARPRLGLALALAVPVLPLGDVSIGLAIAYAAAAACWFHLYWRQPRAGMAFVIGPALAAVGLLALVALGSSRIGGALQRALTVAAAVAATVGLAGLQGRSLPFVEGALVPAGLGLAGSESPTAVIAALARYAWSQPALLTVTTVLVLVAVLVPLARAATLWQLSLASSAIVATMLLIPTLALNTNVRAGEVVFAVAVGLALLARPALIALGAAEPGSTLNASKRIGATLVRRIPLPRAALRRAPAAAQRTPATSSTAAAASASELGPIVAEPISLEEAWSDLIDA